jgi:plasmid maintenance system antidote protein VapI
MTMPRSKTFHPDWASAPGETIADLLSERRMSVHEFARHIEESSEHATDLLEGRATITIGVARKLERVLGATVQFWISRDFQYRETIARLHAADREWLRELPVGDMIKFGWLKPTPRPSEEVAECLRFFNVASVALWRQTYAGLQQAFTFRTSPSFESHPGSVAAWLRQGEIEGSAIKCKPWNPAKFKGILPEIRTITREKDPSRFLPALRRVCASVGVAVAIVRAPNGCRASGAARLLSPTKALLLLSFRHLTDDQFWFSFFHEAGHLVLHGDAGLFLDGAESLDTKAEREANDFAADALIPPEYRNTLLALPLDSREIIRFALKIGVAPGIVVGQLQHFKKLTHRQLNTLKRRFQWGG